MVDNDIMSILFQKGFHFFSGIKSDILEYEFSTLYHSRGSTIGLIVDNDIYRINVNLTSGRSSSRPNKKENRQFQDRKELIRYLNEI